MIPIGYCVASSTSPTQLLQSQKAAVERAIKVQGTATPLFSIPQIIEALEESTDSDAEIAIDQVERLDVGDL